MLDPSASLGSLAIRDETIPALVFLSYPCTGSFLDWIGTEFFFRPSLTGKITDYSISSTIRLYETLTRIPT